MSTRHICDACGVDTDPSKLGVFSLYTRAANEVERQRQPTITADVCPRCVNGFLSRLRDAFNPPRNAESA